MVPHVHLDPPRLDYLITVHLPVGRGRYRAYTCRTNNPTQWLRVWEENWQEVAADLWDYRGLETDVKSTVNISAETNVKSTVNFSAVLNSVSAMLKLNTVPEGFRRRV